MKLYKNIWGDPSHSKKLLLLHGMGGTGSLWRPIAAALEDRFYICAPDQRGHGKSREQVVPNSFTPLDYGTDVIETLSEISFQPCFGVGHSMGVRTLVSAASLKPEYFKSLILVDLGFAGPAGGGLGNTLSQFLKLLPESFASREIAKKFLLENCPDLSIGQYLLAVSQQNLKTQQVTFPFDPKDLIATIEAAKESTIRNSLKVLAQKMMPILVLRGAESKVWSKGEFNFEKNEFKEFKNVVFEEFAGTGHGLPFEKRPEFCERLVRFFAM